MFPLYDDNPTRSVPIVTLLLLAATASAWWYIQGAGFSSDALEQSICTLGAIPAEVTGMRGGVGPCPIGGLTWQTLVTSMFMHGSWMHLIGNLWFLWIFGNNIEDSLGHLRYLVFYLVSGVVAAAAHIVVAPASAVPMVGASGAISAVMGAYLLLHPKARVYTLFFFLVFVRIIPIPAWLMLGYWIFIQLASSAVTEADTGGVAYVAHVGGFAAGIVLVLLFGTRRGRR